MPSMSTLHNLLSSYKDVATLLAIVAGLGIVLWLYLPPIRLVWRCLSREERFPLLRTLEACRVSIWPFKPAIFRKQMRLWLELRLLRPKPQREAAWSFDPKTKRYQLDVNEEGYRRELVRWKRDISGKFGALKIKEQEPLIEVGDVFRLSDDATKAGIKYYLLAVSELKLSLDEEASFLCKVKINEGFLLPLNLLAGLMSRFSDDWDPILSHYGQMVATSLSPLQGSLFDLWLLWGPSVPICRCDQWSGPTTLQYGFGDENNSVRVRVQGKAKETLLEELRRKTEARPSRSYPALHASIVGRLWPPSSFAQGEFCGAQHELLDPSREAFILEYESHAPIGHSAGGHLFYSAYVWAMFVIGREKKPTLEEVSAAPWLKVIPFFEHANIVDEVTYETAKQQLAVKVLNFLKNSSSFDPEPGLAPLRLWYICALDDSGCGQTIEVPPPGEPIRQILARLLATQEHGGIKPRIVLDDTSFAEVLSGCHLGDAISRFFKEIGMRQGER